MVDELKYFDGHKAVDISTITADQWHDLFGVKTVGGGHLASEAETWATVGWVNRCVAIRANSVAHMPWSITKGDTEIARDDERNEALPWLDRMGDVLFLTESALSITSNAYVFKQANRRGDILSMQWLTPTTMSPRWSDDQPEVVGFDRQLGNGKVLRLETDDVIYTRALNPMDELGIAPSPVAAAMADAGVLFNLNVFAEQFFARGAIKAMLLTVEGSPSQADMDKLEAWWKRWFRGIRSAWETAAVRANVKPIVIGEGIEALANRGLTDEKREAISTAMGVPHSIVMSNAANFATAQADRLNLYDFTILPECRVIADALNRQLFDPLGLRFDFRPEALPVYQSDEKEASETIKNLAAAGIRPSHAMVMLGRSLPDGISEAEFDAGFDKKVSAPTPAQLAAQATLKPADSDESADEGEDADEGAAGELRAFRNWLKNNPNRVGRLDDFEAFFISDEKKRAVAYDHLRATIDTDDEYAKRLKLEKRLARDMERGLEEWLSDVLPGVSENEVHLLAQRLRDGQTKFRDILQRALMESATLGVEVAIDAMAEVGIAFDYTGPHVEASQWVRRYTDALMVELNTTNDAIVGEAVARWVDNAQPIEALFDDLRPWFGDVRAKRIARTEVTRAYAEGSKAAYVDSGAVDGLQWVTRQDEMVCRTCEPLHGNRVAVDGEAFFIDERTETSVMVPPAHPNCRCFIAPVVN